MAFDALFWLIVFVVLLALEAITTSLVSLWFAVGALSAFLVAMFGGPVWLQGFVFILVTALSLVFLFPIVKKRLNVGKEKTNVDSLVGKTCVVTKAIDFNQYGQVSVSGVIWTASSGEAIAVDEAAMIIGVEGNKLIVKKYHEQ